MVSSFDNLAITTFPDISSNEFKAIEKKYLIVILLNIGIFFIISIAIVLTIDFTKILDIAAFSLWIYIGITVFSLFLFFIKFIGFKKRKYLVREKDISYKNGILFKNMTTVPFNRIQHLEIDQGPFSRLFNLVVLSVFTAGDSSDDLKISGLLRTDAEKIKEFISSQIDG